MPRMTFKTIYTDVETISVVTNKRDLIKRGIQTGLDLLTNRDLPYLMTDGSIQLIAPYETGTITVTNGSKTITGLGTTFTSAMVGRKIRVSGENVWYRIASYSSATSITIDIPYQSDTESGASFSIYKDEYRLASDMSAYKVARQMEDRVAMGSLEATAFDILEPVPTSEGTPRFEILTGSKLDTYSTGTVSSTVGSAAITGSSTSWLSVEGLGKGTRLTIGSDVYTVKSVDSDTQITVYELAATTVSGSTYSLLMDNMRLQVYPIPDAAENIYYRYQRIPYSLRADADIPDLPDEYHHILITAGLIIAYQTKDKAESGRQLTIFDAMRTELWRRAGAVASSRIYERENQDYLAAKFAFTGPKIGNDYGVPFSLI